jgi:hypothetical protein
VYSSRSVNPRDFLDYAPTMPELQKKNGAGVGAVKKGVVQKN